MSVIVKNSLDNSYRYFIKGAPEKIASLCIKSYLPKNFEEMLMEHTKKGLRVLACATKLLPDNDSYHKEKDRSKYENDLKFLGLIMFHNKLKPDTKHVISNLKNSNVKLVMSTGDNPFTSLSVAREAEMINDSNPTFFIEIENKNDDTEILKM